MGCGCQSNQNGSSNGPVTASANGQDGQVYGISTALDGTKLFWGVLQEDATRSHGEVYVEVLSTRASDSVVLKLRSFAAESIRDLNFFKKGQWVFGAFKPDSIFEQEDNASSDLGVLTVSGTFVTIDPAFTSPSRLVDQSTIDAARKLSRYEVSSGGTEREVSVFDQLGITDEGVILRILIRIVDTLKNIIYQSNDVVLVYAVAKAWYTIPTFVELTSLFADGYVVGSVDAIPCRPGVDTGRVFAVWRLYQPLTAERKTFVQKIDLRTLKDAHIRGILEDTETGAVDFVDPTRWDVDSCGKCRRACASAFLKCFSSDQGVSGPEAVKLYKQCLDDARTCYDSCIC